MIISHGEFLAALHVYVRNEDGGGIHDERSRILKGFIALGVANFGLLACHDMAAALTVACRPKGQHVVICAAPEIRAYLDAVEATPDGRGFEKALARVLAKCLAERDSSHLIWSGDGPKAHAAPEVLPAEDDQILPAPESEPGSLFDAQHADQE